MGVGRSFQIPQPFEGLTVFENLLTAAAFGRGGPESAAVDDCARILDATELLNKANVVAGTLSLLDRKRLELARAMATGPQLLLLDEIAAASPKPNARCSSARSAPSTPRARPSSGSSTCCMR